MILCFKFFFQIKGKENFSINCSRVCLLIPPRESVCIGNIYDVVVIPFKLKSNIMPKRRLL